MRGIIGLEQRSVLKNTKKLLKNANLAMHVGSLALAVEALEQILIRKGVLAEDELMRRIETLAKERYSEET